jgi:hypothetical protein
MSQLRCELDHLVVACRDLAQGAAWLHQRLGVEPQPGGKHATMGTHNALLKLGPRVYLELIAIDPAAPARARPRWFDLDQASVQERARAEPFLLTWVARANHLVEAVTRVPALGDIHALSRGAFAWQIAIPDDGALQFGGVLPMVLQWQGEAHPAESLEDRGCALRELRLQHPAATSITPLFRELRVTGPVELRAGPKALSARIVTARGEIEI